MQENEFALSPAEHGLIKKRYKEIMDKYDNLNSNYDDLNSDILTELLRTVSEIFRSGGDKNA